MALITSDQEHWKGGTLTTSSAFLSRSRGSSSGLLSVCTAAPADS